MEQNRQKPNPIQYIVNTGNVLLNPVKDFGEKLQNYLSREKPVNKYQTTVENATRKFRDAYKAGVDYFRFDEPVLKNRDSVFSSIIDRNLRGGRAIFEAINLPSYAVGGAIKASRESLTGEYTPPPNVKGGKYVHPLLTGVYRGLRDKQAIFDEAPKTFGLQEGTLPYFAVGLGAELLTPDPTDVRLLGKADEATEVGKATLKGLMNETESVTKARRLQGVSPKEAYGLTDEFTASATNYKRAFEDWVNTRRASNIGGIQIKEKFAELDNLGVEGLFKVQAGRLDQGIRNFFDDAYRRLRQTGIDVNYKKDYLPQLWLESEDDVNKVLGRTLGTNPSFTMERVIKDYHEGIEQGLTPRYESISNLAGWYESRVNKTIADKKFFEFLKTEDFIKPANKAPRDWVSIDPDRFPSFNLKLEDGTIYNGTYKAPSEMARLINNYLGSGEWEQLSKVAKLASRSKNIALSGGVPKTALNAHGWNILARNVLTSNNPLTAMWRGLKYMVNPSSASKAIDLEEARIATRYGLTLGVEDHTFNIAEETIKSGLKGKLNKVSELQQDLLETPLFGNMIPALKLNLWRDTAEDLIKNGFTKDEAYRIASKVTNETLGGINVEALGRDRNLQNFLRATILAPDWAETSLRIAKGIGQGVLHPRDPQYKLYRRIVRNTAFMYVSASIVNKVLSGHFIHENDAGHNFEIQIGYTPEGKARYFRPFNTALDFVRLPYDIMAGLAQGDPSNLVRTFTNRLSIPASIAGHIIFNTDYRGQPLYGRDKYGNQLSAVQSLAGVTGELSKAISPSVVRGGIDLASGRTTKEEALASSLELPLRYQTKVYNSEKDKFALLKDQGLSTNQAVQLIKDQREYKDLATKARKKLQDEKDISVDELDAYLGISEVLAMPNTSAFETAQKDEERLKLVRDVMKDENLSDDQKQSALNRLGVDPELANTYYIGTLNNKIKTAYVKDQLKKTDNPMELLLALRLEVAGERILSNGVIDALEDEGIINSTQAVHLKKDGSPSKSSSQFKSRKVSVPNISVGRTSSQRISVPQISTDTASRRLPIKKAYRANPLEKPEFKKLVQSAQSPVSGLIRLNNEI